MRWQNGFCCVYEVHLDRVDKAVLVTDRLSISRPCIIFIDNDIGDKSLIALVLLSIVGLPFPSTSHRRRLPDGGQSLQVVAPSRTEIAKVVQMELRPAPHPNDSEALPWIVIMIVLGSIVSSLPRAIPRRTVTIPIA